MRISTQRVFMTAMVSTLTLLSGIFSVSAQSAEGGDLVPLSRELQPHPNKISYLDMSSTRTVHL